LCLSKSIRTALREWLYLRAGLASYALGYFTGSLRAFGDKIRPSLSLGF
jgi:hypothetical protein